MTEEHTIVERVMRAIAENLPSPCELGIVWTTDENDETSFDLVEARKHEGWDAVARAAIEAMRELAPTIVDAIREERQRCAALAKADMEMSLRNMNNYPPTDLVGRTISAGSAAAGRRIASAILGVDID